MVALKVVSMDNLKAGPMVDWLVARKVDLMVVATVVYWESLKAEMSADHWAVLLVLLKVVSKVDLRAAPMVDWLVARKVDLMVVAKVANWVL